MIDNDTDYTKWAKELYPDCAGSDEECFGSPGNYGPIIRALGGEPIICVEEGMYQGDTYVLYRYNKDDYGFLNFGWGSCSVCDALQACESYADIGKVIQTLESQIKRDTREELLKFFKSHDWAGDYGWCNPEKKRFVATAITFLEFDITDD